MKTIKISVLVLLSTLFLSCSENDNDLFEEIVKEEVEKEDVLISKTYHFKQYYENPVVINNKTNSNNIVGYSYSDGSVALGSVIFQQRYVNNQVIDTLTIDLTSFPAHLGGVKKIRLSKSSLPNAIEAKYATINYLNIIGLDKNPDLKIIGDSSYGKVQIINSNVSVDKLNSISGTMYKSYDMFEKIDYERKEWEWTYIMGSDNYAYENLQNRPTGFIGYAHYDNRGIKIEIMKVTENYQQTRF